MNPTDQDSGIDRECNLNYVLEQPSTPKKKHISIPS